MQPGIGIILGTGLGGLVKEMKPETVVDYGEIPHFPISTVESHHGKLIFGTLGWSLITNAPLGILLAIALFVFFDLKTRPEEKWLSAFP